MADVLGEFESGASITAHDYEEIVTNLNDIYGLGTGVFGYGSITSPAADLPLKSVGGLIENEDWRAIKQAFEDTSDHQSQGALPSPLPVTSDLEGSEDVNADLIGFSPGIPNFGNFNSALNVSTITANSNFSSSEIFATTVLGTPSVRTAPWSVQIEHRFILTFDTQDDARAHFNTGGEIHVEATRTGGSTTAQNTAWSDLLTTHSPFIFGSPEYFGLTTSFATVFTGEDISGGPYDVPDPITWLIQAKSNDAAGPRGGKGNIITIRSVFLDQHVGIDGGPDSVDGTFTSLAKAKSSNVIFVKPDPAYVLDEIPASPPFDAIPYDLIGS